MAKKDKSKNNDKNKLTYENRVRNLFITIYYEQLFDKGQRLYYLDLRKKINEGTASPHDKKMVEGMEYVVKENLKYHIEQMDKAFFITGIEHNKDLQKSKDNLAVITKKKSHFHIAVWRLNGEAFKIRKILQELNIIYDSVYDYNLWQEGLETFRKNHRPNILMYETHETIQSMLDGKHVYDLSEVMTNQPVEKLEQVRSKYSKVTKHARLTDEEWDQASEDAYKLGYDLKDIDTWADTVFTAKQRSSSIFNKDIRNHYDRGLNDRINANNYTTRVSILIWGKHNSGKSYTTLKTLNALGENIYKASTKSGKYDGMTANKTAMVFNDVPVSDPLSVFDNVILSLYRRNRGFAPWCGHLAIATTNQNPWAWIGGELGLPYWDNTRYDESMEYRDKSKRDLYEALESRLYICHIEYNHLVCDSVEERSKQDSEEAKKHDELFIKFVDKFNEILSDYNPTVKPYNAGIYVNDKLELKADNIYDRFVKNVGKEKATGYMSEELKDAISLNKSVIDLTKVVNDNLSKLGLTWG